MRSVQGDQPRTGGESGPDAYTPSFAHSATTHPHRTASRLLVHGHLKVRCVRAIRAPDARYPCGFLLTKPSRVLHCHRRVLWARHSLGGRPARALQTVFQPVSLAATPTPVGRPRGRQLHGRSSSRLTRPFLLSSHSSGPGSSTSSCCRTTPTRWGLRSTPIQCSVVALTPRVSLPGAGHPHGCAMPDHQRGSLAHTRAVDGGQLDPEVSTSSLRPPPHTHTPHHHFLLLPASRRSICYRCWYYSATCLKSQTRATLPGASVAMRSGPSRSMSPVTPSNRSGVGRAASRPKMPAARLPTSSRSRVASGWWR